MIRRALLSVYDKTGLDDFARVYLRRNAPGPQRERWFHAFGCRRWVSLTRDTVTNRIDPGVIPSGG